MADEVTDLSKLSPEVREAYAILNAEVVPAGGVSYPAYRAWCTIHAELLRLSAVEAENGRLSGKMCLICGAPDDLECPQRNDALSPCTFDPSPVEAARDFFDRALKAEAELKGLKERIASAPVYEIPASKPTTEEGWAQVIESAKNLNNVRGQRVRLLIEVAE